MDSRLRAGRSRRQFLRTVGGASALALAGCQSKGDRGREPDGATPYASPRPEGTPTPGTIERAETERESEESNWEIDPVENETRVGAYYYLWYEQTRDWQNWLRKVPGTPVLGEYNSENRAVINQHVKWAREHGINWFAMSWGGPEGSKDPYQDAVLKNEFLEAELGDQIDFSIHYGSTIRLETAHGDGTGAIDFDDERNREKLREDFEYIAETYFDRSNYLTIDGRPVLDLYAAHAFTGPVRETLRAAKDAIDDDPYLIAAPFNLPTGVVHRDWMAEVDAAWTYNVYDGKTVAEGDYADFLEYAEHVTQEWSLGTHDADLDFIPNVIPGYDDSTIRENPVLERTPERFRQLCRALRDWMDPALDAIMVTSFNEWPEFTAVEPAESFGTIYLEVIEEELARAEPTYPEPDRYDVLQLEFDRTVRLPDSDRDLALMMNHLEVEDEAGETLASYDVGIPVDEPSIVEGAYRPEQDTGSDWGTWRWFGGPTAAATFYLGPDLGDAATARIGGVAIENGITADVSFNGRRTGRQAFEDDLQHYAVSLRPEA